MMSGSPADSRNSPLSPTATRLVTGCAVALLAVAGVRVSCSHDPFPGWSGDPFEVVNPILGITPRVSMALDVLALFASGIILACERVRPLLTGFLILAAAAVLLHCFHVSPQRLDDAVLGLTWLSGLASAMAMMACCRRVEIRSLAMASLAGMMPLLAFKGLHQYLVEHRETLAAFLADKDRFLAAQGWAPGSAMALGYERRLSQPEATGWFGLANVYASLAAATLVLGVGMLLPAFVRPSRIWKRTGAVLLTLLGAAMLGASGAKGGMAAAALGIGVLASSSFARARPASHAARLRIATALAIACVAGPLALVLLRGLIGTAWGELSILFRWFYLQGATTIAQDHWMLGTGPAGFREAYMFAKPPLAPEDVTSPHSVLFDYASTLGIGGVAAGGLFFAMALGAARTCMLPAAMVVDAAVSLRTQIRLAVAPIIAAVMVGAMLEQAIQSPAMTLLRIMALGCGGLVAATILSVARHAMAALGVALAAAALALAAHAQIEMTMVTQGSVGWICCLLGTAAAASEAAAVRAAPPSRLARIVSAAPCGAALACAALLTLRVVDWESHLRMGYAHASVIAEFQTRMASMERSMVAREDSPARLVEELSDVLGTSVPSTPEGVAAAMARLRERKAAACLEQLESASKAWPDHFATGRVFARLLLARGLADGLDSETTRRALEVTRRGAREAGTSVAWSWHATCLLAADPAAHRDEAINALRRAASLAPREPSHAVRLARLLEGVDRIESAAWAARALACDDNMRLDPLLQLPEAEREAMRALSSVR